MGILLVLKMDLGKRVEYVMGSFLLSMLTSIKVSASEQLWLLKSGVRALPHIPCLWVNLCSVLLLNQTLALFYASAAFSVHWHIFPSDLTLFFSSLGLLLGYDLTCLVEIASLPQNDIYRQKELLSSGLAPFSGRISPSQ